MSSGYNRYQPAEPCRVKMNTSDVKEDFLSADTVTLMLNMADSYLAVEITSYERKNASASTGNIMVS